MVKIVYTGFMDVHIDGESYGSAEFELTIEGDRVSMQLAMRSRRAIIVADEPGVAAFWLEVLTKMGALLGPHAFGPS